MSKNNLQSNTPGIFAPTYSHKANDKVSNIVLKSKKDMQAGGIEFSKYYIYDSLGDGIRNSAQIPLDFSKFENHTFFNSAQANVNVAFDNIINRYPFDGTKSELEEFLNGLTGFEKYVLDEFPKNVGSLVFSGATGGTNIGTFIEVKDFAGAEFIDFSKDKSGDSVLNFKDKSLSLESHVFLNPKANGNEIIFQKLSGSSQGFTLALSQSSSTTSAHILFGITSGSYSLAVSGAVDKNKFNHVCAVYDRSDEEGKLKLYSNQELIAESTDTQLFNEIDFNISPMYIGSGSIQTGLSLNNLSFIPDRTFSGSLDEAKVFHAVRSVQDQKNAENRSIYASSNLKLYFKFNEPSGSIGNNSIVLDSSGKSLHSTVSNYSLYNRLTGSFPQALSAEINKFNPVLFPVFGPVSALNSSLLASANSYDETNPNLITKLVPNHYLTEGQAYFGFTDEDGEIDNPYTGGQIPGSGELGASQILSSMLFTWAKSFDDTKIAIDQFSQILNPSYDTESGIADTFLPFLSKHYGLELPPILTDANGRQFYHGEDVQSAYKNIEKSLQSIRTQLLKRMLMNVQDIITSKGTIHSVKATLRTLGLDPDILVRIKEYGGPKRFSLSSNRASRATIFPSLTFSGAMSLPASPVEDAQGFSSNVPHMQTGYLSGSRYEVGYPQPEGTMIPSSNSFHGISNLKSDGLQTSGSWTTAINVRFPGVVTGSYDVKQSIVRMHVTGTLSPAASQGILANLVYTSGVAPVLTFYLRSSGSASTAVAAPPVTLFLSGANISDGEYWTLSFGRQRSGSPAINSSVSSSYFLRAATQINGQVEQLFQTSSFYQESFDNNDVQGNVSELNTSGSFLVIGSQSIDNTQNLFLNAADIIDDAKYTSFQGNVGFVRFWSKAISENEFREHARDPRSVGTATPTTSFNFTNTVTGSFEKLRLDVSMDQIATGSNASGEINLIDFSQNSIGFNAKGFEANKDLFKYEKIFYSSIAPAFDEMENSNKIRARSFISASNYNEYDVATQAPVYVIPRDQMPEDDARFSIDFSVANALNEDIVTIFSTLEEIDNAIGNPELLFSQDYPALENLRDMYFNKLIKKVNFKEFLEFFRWFDRSIGDSVENLMPKKTNFLGVNFVIEPHSLERSKLQYQFNDMYIGEDFRTDLKGMLLLQQIAGHLRRF